MHKFAEFCGFCEMLRIPWNFADLGEFSKFCGFQKLFKILSDFADFAPGHDGWVIGDEQCVMYEIVEGGKDFGPWKHAN